MKILVLGGTRFFGVCMVEKLIADGHDVTVATRGIADDTFGDSVKRVLFDHRDEQSICSAFKGQNYDAVIDKIAFSSNDVKRVLDHISTKRYILMSTSGVYHTKHLMTHENDFDPWRYPLQWGERSNDGGFDYDEGKRQAECALAAMLPQEAGVMVRYPVVMGKIDYTKRLLFYVEHIVQAKPMYISNPDVQIGFLSETEAGHFFCQLLDTDLCGPVNACSDGSISMREILEYVERRTNKRAVLADVAEPAPYNGFYADCTLDTGKAQKFGIKFRHCSEWIYELLDYYIDMMK